jgi:hypothetical protein
MRLRELPGKIYRKFKRDPRGAFVEMFRLTIGRFLSDKAFLKVVFLIYMGERLDIKNPQTYNAKLQWMKLYDRNPLYISLVDKYEVRKYVESAIGSKYLIPCLGVWDCFDDIDFDGLPSRFVLKCTHDSGGLVICLDKNKFDKVAAKARIETCLKHNYYNHLREWPYKDIKPRIIAETYMVDESGVELKDYKFFCFDGEVKAMFIASDRQIGETKFDFYDKDFNHLPFTQGHPNSEKALKMPDGYEDMVEISQMLSKGLAHVRVDLYNINGCIYFGELTLTHYSGLVPFVPREWDVTFGSWLHLPERISG